MIRFGSVRRCAVLTVVGTLWFGVGMSVDPPSRTWPVLAAGILSAAGWWEKKPYMEWSTTEVYELLNDSPWVGFSLVAVRTEPGATRVPSAPPGTIGNPPTPVRKERLDYCVRVLTARPVREAMLRRISLGAVVESVVKIEDFKGKGATAEARLDEFISTRPNDLRIRGDTQNIVIGVTIRTISVVSSVYQTPPSSSEEKHPEDLLLLALPDLTSDTQLVTSSGSRAPIVRYEPPGSDQLGAKFYFSRTLPDGSPLIQPGDKELRFETRLREKNVRIRFDLRRMIYKGKLEM